MRSPRRSCGCSRTRRRTRPAPSSMSVEGDSVKPTFFETPAAFRAWLKKHHKTADELIVGFYRKDSGKPSITWQEAVDEALCFGWIDGIRRKHSEIAYSNRFTPRRPR